MIATGLPASAAVGRLLVALGRPRRLLLGPERLVLVIIGALFNRMAPVLWLIAVLSTITVIHRVRYTYTRTEGPDALPAKAGQAA